MAMEKWIGGSGQGLPWGAAFGTEINSLANGNAILSSVAITNGTPLDIFMDVDFIAGATETTAAPNFLSLFLYPLLHDGATYGDGRFSSAAVGPPPGNYSACPNISFAAAASTTIAGIFQRIVLPPGTFKCVLWNQSGTTLPSSNTMDYRTYNRSVA